MFCKTHAQAVILAITANAKVLAVVSNPDEESSHFTWSERLRSRKQKALAVGEQLHPPSRIQEKDTGVRGSLA